ncbi:MAG: UDP-N-acetylglucosamine diphosphorylase [Opitutales bacterium]|nr:UDP-N-acetylglucosamine diphosphorylase [Opitutales bacterium]
MKCHDYFTLPEDLPGAEKFSLEAAPWEWLAVLSEVLKSFPESPYPPYPKEKIPPGCFIGPGVHLHPSVKLSPNCTLEGPAIIGPETEIRPGAWIRGKALIGRGAVIGNSTEIKNALLLDGAQVPHFNYVGDSILGQKAHLGAGVILSNLRLDQAIVEIRGESITHSTNLRKCGAFLGDEAEVGCNAVLQPGTVIGRRSLVLPLTSFSGVLPAHTITGQNARQKVFPRRD